MQPWHSLGLIAAPVPLPAGGATASMSKIMTAYIADSHSKEGRIERDDMLPVGEIGPGVAASDLIFGYSL